jgi:hypothetical protein
MARQTQYQRDLSVLDEQLTELVEVTGIENENARNEGAEIREQIDKIRDIDRNMGIVQDEVHTAIKKVSSVSDMTAGNWISWILSILTFVGIIVIWVV